MTIVEKKKSFFCKIIEFSEFTFCNFVLNHRFKGAVMQIENALINDRLRVSKASRKFCIPTIYKFAVIYL